MNWLTNFVLPKIRAVVAKREVPDNLWHKCPGCGQMLFHRELEASLHVCSSCGHHLRLPPLPRLALLFDGGAFVDVALPKAVQDPLKFRDRKRYSERLKEAQTKARGRDAAVVAEGKIGGIAAVAAVFDFEFLGGSMGIAVGEAIVTAARRAVERDAALVIVPSSGGARMQEGILSLMQMPRTTLAVEMVKERGLPYIVILADPTTGGVSASFAMLGDVTLAEPGAVVGFAGARVIEETIREKLPEGFQRAEYLLEHGMVDLVVHAEGPGGDARAHPRPPHAARGGGGDVKSDLVLERLKSLHVRLIDLSLDRVLRLLHALGDPHEQLPPVDARRRHQRQGLDARLPAGLSRGGRIPRPCLYLAAPRPLQRAHPGRRDPHRRGRAALAPRGMRARQRRRARDILRDHDGPRLPRVRAHAGRHSTP